MKAGLCLACGKKGHMFRECPIKAKRAAATGLPRLQITEKEGDAPDAEDHSELNALAETMIGTLVQSEKRLPRSQLIAATWGFYDVLDSDILLPSQKEDFKYLNSLNLSQMYPMNK